MSAQGVTWGFGEVISIANAFNQKSRSEKNRKESGMPPTDKAKATGEAHAAKSQYRGEIEIMLGANQASVSGGGGKTVVAYPADHNFSRPPLQGEHVVVFQGTGPEMGPAAPNTNTGEKHTGMAYDLSWYYLNPLGLQGSVHLNAAPGQNVSDILGNNKIKSDGTTKQMFQEYRDATSGNPGTTGTETYDPNDASRTEEFLKDKDPSVLPNQWIHWFMEKEQQILDLYVLMDAGETLRRAGGARTAINESEDIQPILDKIDEKKEELTKGGFTGDFMKSDKMFDHDTNTGYLELTALKDGKYSWSKYYNTGGTEGEVEDKDFMKTGGGLYALKPHELGFGEEYEKWKKNPSEYNEYGDKPDNDGTGNNSNTSGNSTGQQGGLGTPNFALGQDFAEFDQLCNLQPYEGDTLLQGRFGQSLRFGSALDPKDKTQYLKQPSWEIGMAGPGGPINILRAGQSPAMNNSNNDFIVEDINGDKASIYVCSGQKIQLQLASTVFDALNYPMDGPAGNPDGPVGARLDSNGNIYPSNECSPSGPIVEAPPLDPLPDNVEELELIPGTFPYFQTEKGQKNYGKIMGHDRIRLIQGQAVREYLCGPTLQLIAAARKDDISLKINSAYRGLWQLNHHETGKKIAGGQVPIRKNCAIPRAWRKLDMKDRTNALWTARFDKFDPWVAIPGQSRHQNGTALDLSYTRHKIVNGKRITTSRSSKTGVYAWLIANSCKYGFVRAVSSEEWHFEYNLKYAKRGPFSKIKQGHSTWHGLDRAYLAGKLGPWKSS